MRGYTKIYDDGTIHSFEENDKGKVSEKFMDKDGEEMTEKEFKKLRDKK